MKIKNKTMWDEEDSWVKYWSWYACDRVITHAAVALGGEFFGESLEGELSYARTRIKVTSGTQEASYAMNEPDPCLPLLLPPRYRLRDLILGDYAFNDDGERWDKLNW